MAWRRSQSRTGQLRHKTHLSAGFGPDLTQSATDFRYARRAMLRDAVFDGRDRELLPRRPASARSVITGVLADVHQEALLVYGRYGIQVVALTPGTVIWLGARATPSALRKGDPVIVRRAAAPGSAIPSVAERVWA